MPCQTPNPASAPRRPVQVRCRGPVGWGDALTAAAELGIQQADDVATLLEVLGLVDVLAERLVGRTMPEPLTVDDVPRPPVRTAPDAVEMASPAPGDTAPGTTCTELVPEPVGPVELGTEPLEASTPVPRLPYEPPVPARQLPAALAHLLRRPRPSGDFDVEECVAVAVAGRCLEDPPRIQAPSLAASVQVIADLSTSMLPYLDDVRYFVRQVRDVAGEPRVTVHRVDDVLRPPLPDDDRPVVVISSLGVPPSPTAPAGFAAWWSVFGMHVDLAGADAVALVPHRDRGRLPWLGERLRVVAWEDLSLLGGGDA
jgi:hypothetical protein